MFFSRGLGPRDRPNRERGKKRDRRSHRLGKMSHYRAVREPCREREKEKPREPLKSI